MDFFDRNARAKLEALQKNVAIAAREGLKDSGSFMLGKLKNQILNSTGSAAEKAKQPPHETSQGRFVRRRTGGLVGGVSMRVRAHEVLVYLNQGKVSYATEVYEWSIKKYGRSFLQIAVTMYKKAIVDIFTKEVKRAVVASNALRPYVYENHFPPT